ncbi:MAG: helix-turn-helix domain-containing protein [Hyphomicrobiales bacterium]|nr:helix-turn-helix domain-containing protein [Hyphomicrobiales bacterium]
MNYAAHEPLVVDRSIPGVCGHASHGVDCLHCKVRPFSPCAALDDREVLELSVLARASCYAPRQAMMTQDEHADSVLNVTEGAVRLYRLLPDGRRQVVGFAIPGDFLGLSMTDRNVYCADALTAVTACKFNRESFSAFLDTQPAFLRKLYDMVGHELRLAQEQMVIIGRRTAEERVVCFLVGLRRRWAKFNGGSVTVPLPMTRQDIADFLGLTIETVSRAISKLAREKAIVVVPDGVRLLEPARLEDIAAG